MNHQTNRGLAFPSRREFLHRLSLASLGGLAGAGIAGWSAETHRVPVVVFSKAYQPLKFSFDQAAEFTAEAGLDGVDSPVRPDGEIVPERVEADLPVYVDALRKRGLQMPYVTTAITSTASPKAEVLLQTAKRLDVKRYRLGFMFRAEGDGWKKQLQEVRARLKDLAALNKQLGIGAVLQNHSPSGHTYVGGDVDELAEIVEGFDPEQLGVAFDIAHAINVHGVQWRSKFDRIRSHLRVVYVKDCNRQKQFVPLGQGQVGASGYFEVLKELRYNAPVSLHIEYSGKAQPETRPELLMAVQNSLRLLRGWLA
jgi:sugar phosphate isomerase/epimerase